MKPPNLTGILVFAFCPGVILAVLGAIIRIYKAADIINIFNEKKMDREKTSRIIGRDFLATGLTMMISPVTTIFINEEHYTAVMIGQAVILAVGIIVSIYDSIFKCKKTN